MAVKRKQKRKPVRRISQTLDNTDIQNMLNFILQAEGGHYNSTDPHGGSTFGLSAETLARANREGVTKHTDIRTLPRKDAAAIYMKYYLPRSRGINTTYPLALVIYDAEINQGRGGMTKAMQIALQTLGYDIAADGGWGKQTQSAFNSARAEYGDIKLARALIDARERMYKGYSKKQHLEGWLNRLANLRQSTGLNGKSALLLNYPLASEELGKGMGFRDMMIKSGWGNNFKDPTSWTPQKETQLFTELLKQTPATGYSQSAQASDVKIPQNEASVASRQRERQNYTENKADFFDDVLVMLEESKKRAAKLRKYQPIQINTTL